MSDRSFLPSCPRCGRRPVEVYRLDTNVESFHFNPGELIDGPYTHGEGCGDWFLRCDGSQLDFCPGYPMPKGIDVEGGYFVDKETRERLG